MTPTGRHICLWCATFLISLGALPAAAAAGTSSTALPAEVPLWQEGKAQVEQGLYTKAVRTLSVAVQKTPDSPHAWYWLGKAFENYGALERAQQAYERTAQIDPAYPALSRRLIDHVDEEAFPIWDPARPTSKTVPEASTPPWPAGSNQATPANPPSSQGTGVVPVSPPAHNAAEPPETRQSPTHQQQGGIPSIEIPDFPQTVLPSPPQGNPTPAVPGNPQTPQSSTQLRQQIPPFPQKTLPVPAPGTTSLQPATPQGTQGEPRQETPVYVPPAPQQSPNAGAPPQPQQGTEKGSPQPKQPTQETPVYVPPAPQPSPPAAGASAQPQQTTQTGPQPEQSSGPPVYIPPPPPDSPAPTPAQEQQDTTGEKQ